jgi:hypothetical protein
MENTQRDQDIQKIMEHKWKQMEQFTPFLRTYLHDNDIPEGYTAKTVLGVMTECLSMLFGELNNKLGKLNKYEPEHYTDSDFVDMVIDTIGETLPDKNDREAVLKYVEDFRIILWGHTNHYAQKYIGLYTDLQDKEKSVDAAKMAFPILRECATIVMVECLLRKYERE